MKYATHLLLLILFFTKFSYGQISSTSELCDDPQFHQTINDLWVDVKPTIINYVANSGADSYNLYNIQIIFEPLLRYSFEQKEYTITDSLLSQFLGTIPKLTNTNKYQFFNHPSVPGVFSTQTLDKYYKMWVDGQDSLNPSVEDVLSSAQFLAMISYAVFEISKMSTSVRTAVMINFVNKFVPVLNSHYNRWVFGVHVNGSAQAMGHFQRKAWGCKYNGNYVPSMLTHREVMQKLYGNLFGNGSSNHYCNAVQDADLWIISGVTSLLASHYTDNSLVPTIPNLINYGPYLNISNIVLQNHTTTTSLLDFNGNPVSGAIFGKNDWNGYSEHDYSGYTGLTYPAASDVSPLNGTGWDISHGRRFISVLSTIYETNIILGLTFPDSTQMVKFTNQFIYQVFNKDFTYPSFSNYLDGSNGWYRVNGSGFGYQPSDLSISVLTGLYGEYIHFNEQVDTVMTSLYNLIHFPNSVQRDFVIETYEKGFWNNYIHDDHLEFVFPLSNNTNTITMNTKRALLSFYCSICHSSNSIPSTLGLNTNESRLINIYPNPANDLITIETNSAIAFDGLKIFTLLGVDVTNDVTISSANSKKLMVDISRLKTGMYIFKSNTTYSKVYKE